MNNVLNYQFSIFGDFSLIINNIQSIASKFVDSKKEVSNLIGPNGPQPLYVFSSPQIGIRITFKRIDFLFPDFVEDDLELVSEVINEKIGFEYFNLINRLAINYSKFDRESFQEKMSIINKKIKPIDSKDECKEVNIRYNYASIIENTSLNNIVSIQNTMVQDSRNFESFSAIMFSLDINTVVSSNITFKIDNVLSFFKIFKTLAEKEMNELVSFVEAK